MYTPPILNPTLLTTYYAKIEKHRPGELPLGLTPTELAVTERKTQMEILREVINDKGLWIRLPEDLTPKGVKRRYTKYDLRVELLEVLCTYN